MNLKAKSHIPILDGIRAYAVLMVCVIHFFQVNESSLYQNNRILGIFFYKISQLGLRGVELFFILSGFLITTILLDSKKSTKYFTTFYARRFLRIFPLYYFVLIISFFILPQLVGVDTSGREVIDKQGWLWSYTSNLSSFWGFGGWDASLNFPSFGHFWTLSVEEHFYLLWPLLIFISNEKWLPRIMWFLILISVSSTLIVFLFDDPLPILKWSSIRCAGVLSLGGLIALYRKKEEIFENIEKICLRFVWPVGLLFLLFNFIPRKYEINDVATFFSSTIFFAMLLTISLKENSLTNKLFYHNILFFIGKISYGIYVYHGLLRPFFKEYIYKDLVVHISNGIISSMVYTIICTVISVLIAWISWSILESPILRLKKLFNY